MCSLVGGCLLFGGTYQSIGVIGKFCYPSCTNIMTLLLKKWFQVPCPVPSLSSLGSMHPLQLKQSSWNNQQTFVKIMQTGRVTRITGEGMHTGYSKENKPLWTSRVDGSIILKWMFKNRLRGRGPDWCGSGQGQMVVSCEHGVEPSGSRKIVGNFLTSWGTTSFSRMTFLHGVSQLNRRLK